MFVKNPQDQREGISKIAIPIADGKFSAHFGGAKEFMVFELDSKEGTLGAGSLHPAPEHKPGALPKWLATNEVNAVIVSSIGERALMLLDKSGIKTFLAGDVVSPNELVAACVRGDLPIANKDNTQCNSHHHDHDEHDEHECGHH